MKWQGLLHAHFTLASTNMKPDLRLEFEADKVYFLKHASCQAKFVAQEKVKIYFKH